MEKICNLKTCNEKHDIKNKKKVVMKNHTKNLHKFIQYLNFSH